MEFDLELGAQSYQNAETAERYEGEKENPAVSATREAFRAGRVIRERPALWYGYCGSCFMYTVVGVDLQVSSAALPPEIHNAAPVPLCVYALLLVLQGFMSFGADVYSSYIVYTPVLASGWSHPLITADRVMATTLSLLLIYMAAFLPQDPVQRSISTLVVTGPACFAVARWHYVRKRWREYAFWKILWHLSFPCVSILWLAYTTGRESGDSYAGVNAPPTPGLLPLG
jgi:hypothetical protein